MEIMIYGQASSHYLILPKTTASSPAELGKEHVKLLKQLEIKAHSLASKEPNLSFKFVSFATLKI